MKTLLAAILCLLLILLVIFLVLRKAERKPVPKAERVPVFYTYTLTLSKDLTEYKCHMPDSVWGHYVTWRGDTVQFWTLEKHLLSENRKLINAVTGKIEFENVAVVREVIEYE